MKTINFEKIKTWNLGQKIGLFLLGAIIFLIVLIVGKVWFTVELFSYFCNLISTVFGLDIMLSRAGAVVLTALLLALAPLVVKFFIFGTKKAEVLVGIPVLFVVFSLLVFYATNDVLVDRKSGEGVKYYIKTLDGFKFSNSEDFDSQSGIKYKKITPEIIKEYNFWVKIGKHNEIPPVEKGHYFSMLTGEPIVWYSKRKNGEIKLFSLPGYDPENGEQLTAVTKEIIEKISEISKFSGRTDWAQFSLAEYLTKGGKVYSSQSTSYGSLFIRIEKIFSAGKDIAVGVIFSGESNSIDSPHLVDVNGTKRDNCKVFELKADKTRELNLDQTRFISVSKGEDLRVIFVFKDVSIEEVREGSLYTGKLLGFKINAG